MTTPTLAQVHATLEALTTYTGDVRADADRDGCRDVANALGEILSVLRPLLRAISCPTCGGPIPCELDGPTTCNDLGPTLRQYTPYCCAPTPLYRDAL